MAPTSHGGAGRVRDLWHRRAALGLCAGLLALLAAACQTGGGGGGGGGTLFSLGSPSAQPLNRDFGTYTGEKIKIALLLPLSSKDTRVRTVANSLKEAAELALFDFNSPNIELVPKDTRGTPAGARFAAEEAIQDGAELFVGPLRAQAVQAAGQVARSAGVPVIAFSTTESVAGEGIYLLSFLPSVEVQRMVDFALARGLTRFAALVPAQAYGDLVAGDLTRIVQEREATIFTVERFASNKIAASVERVAQVASKIDALMIAEGSPLLQQVAQRLGNVGGLQLLGTGLWNDLAIASEPALQGAWFPGPPPGTRQAFEQRYRASYGRPPAQIASLGYDAVSLASALARAPLGQRFTQGQITDPNGFAGVDGLFRFRPDGRIERGLAVLQVSPSGFQMIDPAPQAFGLGNF